MITRLRCNVLVVVSMCIRYVLACNAQIYYYTMWVKITMMRRIPAPDDWGYLVSLRLGKLWYLKI